MSAPSTPRWLLILRLRACLVLAAVAFAGGATVALAKNASDSTKPLDPRIAAVLSELEKTRTIHQAALSPDGQMIAWAVDADMGIEIQVAPIADPSRAHRLTAGTGSSCTEDNLAWSPDSNALAFTSDCNAPAGAADQSDVYLATPGAASASPRRLTHLQGG